MYPASRLFLILIILILATSCGGDKIDQLSYNLMAEEIKAEINKLSIPCGQLDVVEVPDVSVIKLSGLESKSSSLEKFKKYILLLEDQPVTITLNKINKDGFQFTYTTDITEYALDTEPVTTRDSGTIWMYCDKYKKYNEPKAAPLPQPSKMVTVE